MAPAEPKPAASVLLVRSAEAGASEPLEVYMIRRQKGMKFLGGYYAFPGGKVDPEDGAAEAVARCHGLTSVQAEAIFPSDAGVPALAYWTTSVRELLEETGLLLACDSTGRTLDGRDPTVAARIDRLRKSLMASEATFAALLEGEGWYADARSLRYLSHFITPT